MKNWMLLLLLPLAFACNKEERQAEEDRQIILDYIADNNLDAIEGGQGLFYVIDNQGGGSQPNINSTVTVGYQGFFTDGSIFDQSGAGGATFPLSGVIRGWQIGIPLFQEGGTGTLLIPSALGYGENGTSGIPGNSVLIFNIDLIDVQ